MNGFKKAMFAVTLLLLLTGSLFAMGNSEQASDVYKVGFIGPLTGDNANYGVRCLNATNLAVSEINAKGGIDGKQIQIISEDSEGAPEKALAAYEKLVYTDNVCAIIGPVFTGESLAVGPRCVEDGIVMITPSASHKDVTAAGDYVFRTTPSDALQSDVAGHYFFEVLGYKNIGILYATNDYSQGLANGVKEIYNELGGKVVAEETFMVGDKDFRTQLTQIASKNPDAIYIPDYTVEMAQILEQAAQLGIKVPFLSGDGFNDPMIYQLAGAYTNGVVYTGSAQAKASSLLSDFQAAYRAAYNGDEPDTFATNAYDAMYILADAIKRAGSADRSAIRDQVAATKDFQGANGTLNFAANGDLVASQGVYLVENETPVYQGAYQLDNGKLVKVD